MIDDDDSSDIVKKRKQNMVQEHGTRSDSETW